MIGGVMVSGGEVWAVVGQAHADFREVLSAPLHLCEAVLDDGSLLVRNADPRVDRLLSPVDACTTPDSPDVSEETGQP